MTNQPAPQIPSSELAAAHRTAADRQAERVRGGAVIVGRKIGYTNMQLWARLGINAPMWGAMYDDTVIDTEGQPCSYSLAPFHGPRIEPELAVHFQRAPAAGAGMDDVLACIDWVASAFEIVVSPLDGKPATVPQAIVNNGMHGSLLLGARQPVSVLGDDPVSAFARVAVELHCDGALKEAGSSAMVMGNPLNAIVHLMEGLRREGQPPLAAGDIVTTGTMTAAYDIAPGQRWTTTLPGSALPGMDVTFE